MEVDKLCFRHSRFNLGFPWIQLILLKNENWKYYSKIIFKCVNSTVGPIFNIFFSWIKWMWISWIVHCVSKNLNAFCPKNKKKKKRRKMNVFRFTVAWIPALIKRKRWMWRENANPNAHLESKQCELKKCFIGLGRLPLIFVKSI